MELYVQYKDYNWMMRFTEQLLERICIAVNGTSESVVDGQTISFKSPYRRLPILDAILEKTGYDLYGKSASSRVAYHIRDGRHEIYPEDWEAYLRFAARFL